MGQQGTPGGQQLRALREKHGRTQLWVEADAELGTGYLQRVESGRVAQPSRGTVERILAALEARYGEAREVLAAFGYLAPAPLPTAAECAWTRGMIQPALDDVQLPAYALDCTARLVAWNAHLPRLIGLRPGTPLPGSMTGRSLLFAWFDPKTPLGATVAEPETLYLTLARAFCAELQSYQGESWPAQVLGELQALPGFAAAWSQIMSEPPPLDAARARVPLLLRIREAGPLEFRLATEPFAQDPRFRTVYLFPADPAAIRWAAGDG